MPTEDLRAIELLRRVPYGRVATSMRALPFLAVARHVVVQGRVLLRMHAGFNHHQACHGSVVAYGADNFDPRAPADGTLWAVQCTGTAELFEPDAAELELFGRGPHSVDGEPFDPVYMRLEPRLVTAHTLNSAPERRYEHAL
ncbi:pyridoxamine 5'-phosphate oxidase family protein [Streptomyces albidochromogenes]|uniref:Pyridoxamine 5'-phosphate oxidase family protein n=1 Tax=Streptomyces albidochromogenes TaxID=329524 RepID=A0ABW6FSB4_9ACTN